MRSGATAGGLSRRLALVSPVALLVAATIAVPLPPASGAATTAGFGPLGGPAGCLLGPGETSPKGAGSCGEGKGLVDPNAVAVSPDGMSVYVVSGVAGSTEASSFGSLAILKREPTSGGIAEVGCLSSDGTDGRDGASGACTPTPSLLGADGVAVSPDGSTVFVASSYSSSVVAFARNPSDGTLKRLGCIGHFPCAAGNVFYGSSSLVVGAGNRSLYVAAPIAGAISALTVPSTPPESGGGSGASAPEPTLASLFAGLGNQSVGLPCIAVNGSDGICEVGVAMQGVGSLTLGPEGKQLYGTAPGSDAVDVFTPNADGTLTETSCLKVNAPPGLCKSSSLMNSPRALAVSPDGKNVYAGDSNEEGGRVDVFSRDPSSGAVTESSCVDFLPPPPHPESKEEEEHEEEETKNQEAVPPDPCTSVPGLEDGGADVVAVSGDGTAVYAIGPSSAIIFSREASTGKLAEASCVSDEDSRCTSWPELGTVLDAAVSPDGRDVYVVGQSGVTAFAVGAAVTTSQATATRAGIARVAVACPSGMHRPCAGHVRLVRSVASRSGHGRHRERLRRIGAGDSAGFTLAPGTHATVSVRLSGSSRRLLLARRRLRLMAVVLARPLAGGSGYGRPVTFRLRG